MQLNKETKLYNHNNIFNVQMELYFLSIFYVSILRLIIWLHIYLI